jgi:hypothetical protein
LWQTKADSEVVSSIVNEWEARQGRKERAMLPPFIIEQIRQREERERRNAPQPFLELPLHAPMPMREREPEETSERGVVIIDLMGD